MKRFLRKTKRGRWIPKDNDWLSGGEFPADVFKDFLTKGGSFSLWEFDDSEAGLEWIVVGVASTGKSLDKFDYIVFDCEIVKEVGLTVKRSTGDTPLEDLNKNHHVDVVECSGRKLFELINCVASIGQHGRKSRKEVIEYMVDAVVGGVLELERIVSTSLREDVRIGAEQAS